MAKTTPATPDLDTRVSNLEGEVVALNAAVVILAAELRELFTYYGADQQ